MVNGIYYTRLLTGLVKMDEEKLKRFSSFVVSMNNLATQLGYYQDNNCWWTNIFVEDLKKYLEEKFWMNKKVK